jgi:hypothetical protein
MTKSRRMQYPNHVTWVGNERNINQIFVGKPLGKLKRKTKKKMEDRINMDLRETFLRITGGWN